MIEKKHIMLGLAFLLLSAAFLFMGFWKPLFFVGTAVSIAGYFVVDKKYLRCPHCGGFMNMDHLFHALSHHDYCRYCGKSIEIKK